MLTEYITDIEHLSRTRTYINRYYRSFYGNSQFGQNQFRDDILPQANTSDEYYAPGTDQYIRDAISQIYYAGYPPRYAAVARAYDGQSLFLTEINPLEQLNVVPLNESDVGDFNVRSQYYNFNWHRGGR